MKRFFIVLALLLIGSVVSAKQCVECYRYAFYNVATAAKNDLDNLISQGYKIISFSLDYGYAYMLVVYDDMEK